MKCQACDGVATHHVTEIVQGKTVEYHVCDTHLKNVGELEPYQWQRGMAKGLGAFLADPQLREAVRDATAREKVSAHQLPALCLALLDPKPEVRVAAAFQLLRLGPDARSAEGALRDALRDPDERVRKAAQAALESIQGEQSPPWFI
jgi:HEAT repeat protein